MMSERASMFVFVMGLILTISAAGSVEFATPKSSLLNEAALSVVGVAIMWVGALGLSRQG
jgi:hypothetical protein